MKWTIVLGLLFVSSASIATPLPRQREHSDTSHLQGRWNVIEPTTGYLHFQGDVVEIQDGKQGFSMRVTIDDKQSPSHINLVIVHRVVQGIYRINGNVLDIAFGDEKTRPTDFLVREGTKFKYITAVKQP